MINRGTTLVLVLLAVLTTAIAVWVVAQDPGLAQASRNDEPVFADLRGQIDDLTIIRLASDEAEFAMTKDEGDTWLVASAHNYPADPIKVTQLFRQLIDLAYGEAKTQKPEHFHRLGLQDVGSEGSNATRITLESEGGDKIVDALFGDPARVGGIGRYFRAPDSEQTWRVNGSVSLDTAPSSWLDREILTLGEDMARTVTFSAPSGETVTAFRDDAESDLVLSFDGDEELAIDMGAVAGLKGILEGVRFDSVVPRANDGWTEAVHQLEVSTFDGRRVEAEIMSRDGGYWLRVTMTATGEATEEVKQRASAFNRRHGEWTYQIPSYLGQRFTRGQEDFLQPEPPES
ncbi:MAG: DUF4340 domain-containing protein [Geminicoccaceae bacterium]